ncbi:MAG: helix-turn-helix domain-containing protein [Zoogloeaceae bacterium]|jgi:DNA-binding XRE family transcriptional regulator|nr:helix-turn-helix domain-containing protein [Zoogloeaceae bacterium]
MAEPETVGDRLRQVRGDMNQDAFAKLLGIGRTSLIRYEKNERTLDADLMARLWVLFKVNALWLLTGLGAGEASTELSPSENALLVAFRQCSEDSRDVLVRTARLMAGKDNPASTTETATKKGKNMPAGKSQKARGKAVAVIACLGIGLSLMPGGTAKAQTNHLREARNLAHMTLQTATKAETALIDGIQTGDKNGIIRQVQTPLQEILKQWPPVLSMQASDYRQQFAYCREAAQSLQILAKSASMSSARSAEGLKYVRDNETQYQANRKKCEAQLARTDKQIQTDMDAEDAELKEKFGGRECLRVLSVDKATGKVVDLPRPAHCK